MVIRPAEWHCNQAGYKQQQEHTKSELSSRGACYDASGHLVVPVLDLSKSEDECVAVAREACEKLGFFYLAGHGVPEHVMDNMLHAAKEFFQKDAATKSKFRATADLKPQGYMHCVEDKVTVDAATQKVPDQREHFRVTRNRYVRDFRAALEDKEIKRYEDDEDFRWFAEDELSEAWKHNVQEYFECVVKTAFKLHSVLALSLGLPRDYFAKYFSRESTMLMMHRYFPTESNPEEGKVGCGQHTDFGMATILLTDGVPGLQVCKDKSKPNNEREWIDVDQKPYMFIVNVADMLEYWSNGQYLSNLHRVVKKGGQERISVATFCDPNADAIVSPVCGSTEKYESIQVSKWFKKRYNMISEEI